MTKFRIDGKQIEIKKEEQNEKASYPQVVKQDGNYMRPPEEITEAGQVLKSLFSNDYDPVSKTHAIDQKANLDDYQVRGLTALDVLDRVNFTPHVANSVSMQTKHLSISKNARGRDDHVNIIQAKKEHEVNQSGGGMLKNLMGMNK